MLEQSLLNLIILHYGLSKWVNLTHTCWLPTGWIKNKSTNPDSSYNEQKKIAT